MRSAKIGSGLALVLEQMTAQCRLEETVNVMIQLRGDLTPSLQKKLEERGLTVQGVVGSTVSGRIQASNIPAMTEINEVLLIDLPGQFRITPPSIELDPTK